MLTLLGLLHLIITLKSVVFELFFLFALHLVIFGRFLLRFSLPLLLGNRLPVLIWLRSELFRPLLLRLCRLGGRGMLCMSNLGSLLELALILRILLL
jgi:hypothetical protein